MTQIKAELASTISANLNELNAALQPEDVKAWIENEEAQLVEQLERGTWLTKFHGKQIFARVCGDILGADSLRVRHAYIDIALREKPDSVSEIRDLFRNM
jgi:hypothetical protein